MWPRRVRQPRCTKVAVIYFNHQDNLRRQQRSYHTTPTMPSKPQTPRLRAPVPKYGTKAVYLCVLSPVAPPIPFYSPTPPLNPPKKETDPHPPPPNRPNFILTLLRTPFLPPTYATFIAPLNLNKLDIKDYLFHAYAVRCLSVRSYVAHMKVRQDRMSAKNPKPRRWYRPRAFKRVTVEMERGFVWPDAPEDFSP